MEDNKRKSNDAHIIPMDKWNVIADHLDLGDRYLHITMTMNVDSSRNLIEKQCRQ